LVQILLLIWEYFLFDIKGLDRGTGGFSIFSVFYLRSYGGGLDSFCLTIPPALVYRLGCILGFLKDLIGFELFSDSWGGRIFKIGTGGSSDFYFLRSENFSKLLVRKGSFIFHKLAFA
jgi:hypothetical protein